MDTWDGRDLEKKLSRKKSGKLQKVIQSKGQMTSSKVKPDIYYALAPIYYMSKICGLLPIKFIQEKGENYCHGKVDSQQVVFGILLLLCCIGAQCWGLYRDLHDGWQNSTRLSSQTAIVVTCSDVAAVMSVVTVTILSSSMRWTHLQQVVANIIEVDEKLRIVKIKDIRRFSIKIISWTFACLAVLSSIDYTSWSLLSLNKENRQFGDKGAINYSPIYFMYIVIMIFEIQYAVVILSVGERFLKLNKAIENITKANEVVECLRRDTSLATTNLPGHTVAFLSAEIGHCTRLCRTSRVSDGHGDSSAFDVIDQLITLHGTLSDSILHINNAYGIAILICTISCLIHLVITPYFLYNELYGSSISTISWYIPSLQVFWIIFHIYRLLLFVQPCYTVAIKARKTGALVSHALTSKWNSRAKRQLEIFALQLMQRPVEFTACGLFLLDRGLVTSIVGSVTTYLVILVQFQNADDTKGTRHLLQNATTLLQNASNFKNISNQL